MEKAEPNDQLKISTLGFVFAHGAHLRRFMHPETKHQGLSSHIFGGDSRSVSWGGYLGISLWTPLRDVGCVATPEGQNL